MIVSACATRIERQPPTSVENCPAILEKVRFRDQFFRGLRGKASANAGSITADAEAAIAAPNLARVEITGPLGIRLGLLQLNPEWVQLYSPRDNLVYRFPTAEMARDTVRRARFLSILPVPLVPELFIDALLTRVNLPAGLSARDMRPTDCGYDPELIAYRLRVPEPRSSATAATSGAAGSAAGGGRWIWVDPANFSPVRILYFDRALPPQLDANSRPVAEAKFSRLAGQGTAVLPLRIQMTSFLNRRSLRVEWNDAEAWPNPDPAVFQWRPTAAMKIRDF